MKIIVSAITAVLLTGFLAMADTPAVHGMALFGNANTYLSHLPMFHSPHDYQLILKVSLAEAPAFSTLAKYQASKLAGNDEFTLVPQVMDLSKVVSGQVTQFKAKIYQGHFEKGGKELGPVSVLIEKQIVASKLNPTAEEASQYVLFGEKGEYFSAHLINGKPSYDMILSVAKPFNLKDTVCQKRLCPDPMAPLFSDAELPKTLLFFAGLTGLPVTPKVGDVLGEVFGLQTSVLKVLYFEEAELAE